MSWQAGRCLACGSLALAILVSQQSAAWADLRGDFDDNGVLDAGDINALVAECILGEGRYCDEMDLNGDQVVNGEDHGVLVREILYTYYGDANVDGQFNSGDLVQVFAAGRYETGEMAVWEEGDFNGDMRFHSVDLVTAFVDGGYEQGLRLGDYNRNGLLDAGDLDLQAIEIVRGEHPKAYDLNGDDLVNFTDRQIWVVDLKNTWIGDANLDGEFNSGDLVQVFVAGKYETGQYAKWDEGDFNGDTVFNSSDFVAFSWTDPGYEQGPRTDAVAVPEPSALSLLALGMLGLIGAPRRRV